MVGHERTGQVYTFPAPMAGLNEKLPIPLIPEDSAINLTNMYVSTDGIKKRNGYERKTTTAITGGVKTLMVFDKVDGTTQLFATGNSHIYLVNTASGATSDYTGSVTVTNDKWQWTQFYNRVFACNGDDRVVSYDGAAAHWSTAGFTVGGSPDANLINVGVYKEALYLIQKDSTNIWYGATRAVTGALTSYDIGSILTKGGYPVICGSTTRDIGFDQKEMFVVITSQGEVLAFTGSNPGDATWAIKGHFYMPKPIDYRSSVLMGEGLQVVTEQGVLALNEVLSSAQYQETGRYHRTSENIDTGFKDAAKTYGGDWGWAGINYTKEGLLIINVPTSDRTANQYVMNTMTVPGPWSKFTDINAACWAIVDKAPYFGDFDGYVNEFDGVQNDAVTGASTGNAITIKGETAFSACGDPNLLKRFLLVKPIIVASGDAELGLAINTDYERTAEATPINVSSTGGSSWGTAEWGTAEWADYMVTSKEWRAVEGTGNFMNIVFSGLLTSVDLNLLAFFVQFEPGGVL